MDADLRKVLALVEKWRERERHHDAKAENDYFDQGEAGWHAGMGEAYGEAADELDAHRDALLRAAENDARYRWLRKNLPPGTFGDFDVFNAESWDAAIDAARAAAYQKPSNDSHRLSS